MGMRLDETARMFLNAYWLRDAAHTFRNNRSSAHCHPELGGDNNAKHSDPSSIYTTTMADSSASSEEIQINVKGK